MTPLSANPTVVVLINELGTVINTATNVAPKNELRLVVVTTQKEFDQESLGQPFIGTPVYELHN